MLTPTELRTHLKKGGVNFMVTTPFTEDQEVDYEGLKVNIEFMLEKTKDFDTCVLTPTGSNGEFVHLNDEELKNVIRTSVETVAGRKVVVAGTGRADAYSTIKMTQYAESVGADGAQVILPYYFIPFEDGMFDHFKQLADAINIGIVVYNNPGFTSSWIKPPLMKRIITEIGEKIAGIKENTPHLMLFNAMAKMVKETGVSLYSGFGEQWFAYQFPWGADGMASPFGNFYPEFPMGMYKAAVEYDFDTMRYWLDRMEPYYAFLGRCTAARRDTGTLMKPGGSIYGEGNIRFGAAKDAMNMMGLRGGRMRTPLESLTVKEKDELREILKYLGLL